MAKKKTTTRRRTSNSAPNDLDQARERVEHARQELRDAELLLSELSDTVNEQAERVKAMTVGEVIDESAAWVRKHPLGSMFAAAGVGYAVGRVTGFFRRWL